MVLFSDLSEKRGRTSFKFKLKKRTSFKFQDAALFSSSNWHTVSSQRTYSVHCFKSSRRTCSSIYMYINIYTYVHIYIYTNSYVYIHIYIYINR